jgi:hypothetical protein
MRLLLYHKLCLGVFFCSIFKSCWQRALLKLEEKKAHKLEFLVLWYVKKYF